MIKRKCPVCKGCMDYVTIENKMYCYCDFCKAYYKVAIGSLEYIGKKEDLIKGEFNGREISVRYG